jgi:hypothetical protein
MGPIGIAGKKATTYQATMLFLPLEGNKTERTWPFSGPKYIFSSFC